MIQVTFQGCAIDVIDIPSPEGGLAARAIVIQDPQSGTQYSFPMDVDGAKSIGQKLMGIGRVEIPDVGNVHKINGKSF